MEEVQQLILWRQKIEDFRGLMELAAVTHGRVRVPDPHSDWRRNAKYDKVKNYRS
jgi:hypothetical protein